VPRSTGRVDSSEMGGFQCSSQHSWWLWGVDEMGRRGRKQALDMDSRPWKLLVSVVGTVEACPRVGITARRGTGGGPNVAGCRRCTWARTRVRTGTCRCSSINAPRPCARRAAGSGRSLAAWTPLPQRSAARSCATCARTMATVTIADAGTPPSARSHPWTSNSDAVNAERTLTPYCRLNLDPPWCVFDGYLVVLGAAGGGGVRCARVR